MIRIELVQPVRHGLLLARRVLLRMEIDEVAAARQRVRKYEPARTASNIAFRSGGRFGRSPGLHLLLGRSAAEVTGAQIGHGAPSTMLSMRRVTENFTARATRTGPSIFFTGSSVTSSTISM